MIQKPIIIVGEFTTPAGPFDDDHFLFVLSEDGTEAEIAVGTSEEFMNIEKELEEVIGTPIDYWLCNKTDFSSRVVYPSELKEKCLFKVKKKELGVVSSFKKMISLGDNEYIRVFSDEVEAFLEGRARNE